MRKIFVFGSNLAGIHGAGSAEHALNFYGAEWRNGEGLQGDSYAIPTKDINLYTLPLKDVEANVHRFLRFARANPDWSFEVVKIGCGLAGFTEDQIKPMFAFAPANCILPEGWR